MISTFDLTLLGSLVSVGGLVFLGQGKWLQPAWTRRTGRQPADVTSASQSRNQFERSTSVTGARWLAVGVLTLFVAHFHGAEKGYLFGPLGDVLFHVVFVSACWGTTAFRLKRAAEQPTGRSAESLPAPSLRNNPTPVSD